MVLLDCKLSFFNHKKIRPYGLFATVGGVIGTVIGFLGFGVSAVLSRVVIEIFHGIALRKFEKMITQENPKFKKKSLKWFVKFERATFIRGVRMDREDENKQQNLEYKLKQQKKTIKKQGKALKKKKNDIFTPPEQISDFQNYNQPLDYSGNQVQGYIPQNVGDSKDSPNAPMYI